jgi:hypothetical protein
MNTFVHTTVLGGLGKGYRYIGLHARFGWYRYWVGIIGVGQGGGGGD